MPLNKADLARDIEKVLSPGDPKDPASYPDVAEVAAGLAEAIHAFVVGGDIVGIVTEVSVAGQIGAQTFTALGAGQQAPETGKLE